MKRMILPRRVVVVVLALGGFACAPPGCTDEDARLFNYLVGGEEFVAWFDFSSLVLGSGGNWTASASSVAANVIVTGPVNRAYWKNASPFCQVASDLPNFDSVEGAPTITFQTSTQSATATYVSGKYQFTGLTLAPGYQVGDSLQVDWTPMGMGGELTLPLPPLLGDPNDHIGMPAGWDTTFWAAPGTYDHVLTLVELDNGEPGYDAVECLFPAEEGNNGSFTLVDAKTRDYMMSDGSVVGPFGFVAFVNVQEVDGPFPGRNARVLGGSMYQFNPSPFF